MKLNIAIKTIILLIYLAFNLKAQVSNYYITESRLLLISEDKKGKPFDANTEFSYMTLNLSNGDFILNAELSTLKTGNLKTDSIIRLQGTQPLIFKGNLGGNLYLFTQHLNDEKDYKMEGQLTINNITIPCIAQYDPLNFSDKNDSKNYRIDFKLIVDPTKISIFGIENNLNNQLIFEIISGKLNTTQ